ncbi:serine/threonine protein kinase [Escherichia coli]|nr:serine/threonine protein kinase [Escherichia coli]
MHVALPLLLCTLPLLVRSCLSWHYPNYPNYPKNRKAVLSPHHDWLKTGSLRQNAPLRIWFYPQ